MKSIFLKRSILIALICSGAGCMPDKTKLVGKWQAVAFFENGKRMNAALEPVTLEFSAEGAYVFRSQGFYQEKGSYRSSAAYLFLTDTTAQPQLEHTVKILYLAPDTLKIMMRSEAQKEQVLFFARHK